MIHRFHYSEWESIVRCFKEVGLVVVQGLITDNDQLQELRNAADVVVERTRNQQWPYKRTVGKQFPPWKDESPDVWGVQHIMHPALGQPAFAAFYFSAPMVELTGHLSDMSPDEHTIAGLHNLLLEPLDHHFALSWHRDTIKSTVDEEEERQKLSSKAKYGGVQWNLALYQDECLFVVPGSHLRTRTPMERQITTQATKDDGGKMPNEICAALAPGEAVFYDPEILHRGTYDPRSKRRTLHGAHLDGRADISRAAGFLQHFKPCGMYYAEPGFLSTLPADSPCGKQMVKQAVDWATRATDLGYTECVQDDI
ncbi:hypothetical protein PGT21_013012 [Puccinia graminis f. sp. tritici]|uniref:Phytanoyl-CoA dioxygenase n=2 Tax=Puccinia graminis f. sp. tritici TaxID=56615 RepID=E3KS13_PUCGT|nr:uncharacterized protein PGTG_13307 [Puccinia graminis f. sp. tritici CRL 75-36-700-3]EFP87088.1 hypothetical protein PGTG_13307 [Puccinia graminis f. sp. tritici CRL 75-36-700-3]KAA1073443.1 hypothetical protein PGT21_012451 [Puccinia graminis f. sp. tritici]KAA1076603.1 hypothetical protein PGT21_013012 [Puccinia graminis f. sp. tritici]KAA1126770.1 hypothetical protein PGTUg99_018260 [Puccinia graminis f. sp. tritici]